MVMMRYLEGMKYVLVTGAAGFLGSHLAQRHLDAGDRVWGFDCFISSDPKSGHFVDLLANEQFVFREHDITERSLPPGLPARFDTIYNFACPASPPAYQDVPVFTTLTCVVGTSNMLDLAGRMNCTLIHASTSEVYGDPSISPQDESYRGYVNSYGPRACYDEGKRAAEALCYDNLHSHEVDARLVRIFNTYGPHMDPYDGRVVSNFIRQALKHEKLTIYGDGRQSRSFCYVDDLIRGIVAVGALEENPQGPINLGNPNEFTVKELAEQVIKKIYSGNELSLELKNMVEYSDIPVDDPKQRCPNIARAKKLLDWEPEVMLDEGLDKTIAYFRTVV